MTYVIIHQIHYQKHLPTTNANLDPQMEIMDTQLWIIIIIHIFQIFFKNKIKSLRSYFANERQKVTEKKSGAGVDEVYDSPSFA
jgi:hypothetical protein